VEIHVGDPLGGQPGSISRRQSRRIERGLDRRRSAHGARACLARGRSRTGPDRQDEELRKRRPEGGTHERLLLPARVHATSLRRPGTVRNLIYLLKNADGGLGGGRKSSARKLPRKCQRKKEEGSARANDLEAFLWHPPSGSSANSKSGVAITPVDHTWRCCRRSLDRAVDSRDAAADPRMTS
jgi:hypothetical protein